MRALHLLKFKTSLVLQKAGRDQVIIDIPDSFSDQNLEITISSLKRNPTKRTDAPLFPMFPFYVASHLFL